MLILESIYPRSVLHCVKNGPGSEKLGYLRHSATCLINIDIVIARLGAGLRSDQLLGVSVVRL